MHSKYFSYEEQLIFSKLSCDYNPIHVDKVMARRTLFGEVILHGVHLVLWVLDDYLSNCNKKLAIDYMKCTFFAPVKMDKKVIYKTTCLKQGNIIFDAFVEKQQKALSLEIKFRNIKRLENYKINDHSLVRKKKPKELNSNSCINEKGFFYLGINKQIASRLFGNLMKLLPHSQIAIILGLSRLVGMECPGLNSIFSSFELYKKDKILNPTLDARLKYKVTQIVPPFNLVKILIDSCDMAGTVFAFIRPFNAIQPSFKSVMQSIPKDIYKNQKAMVVGGSRGLGEIITKILCAGGANVRFTYNVGLTEAMSLVKQIKPYHPQIDYFQLDVTNKITINFLDDWIPTHLYYLATPRIESGIKEKFSLDLFHKYFSYYIDGLLHVLNEISKKSQRKIKIFCPSTTFLDKKNSIFAEYTSSKLCCEHICKILSDNDYANIFTPRIKRLSTDQNTSLLKKGETSVSYITNFINQFNLL
ncbi:TPA: SDR family NAD(P)-dependent oxidoreductase [Legionella pneumophila]|nr:SDR family NAD(P)-dependent oxidoreductase [Legionella pneumophila]